jgi:hypothetical protein
VPIGAAIAGGVGAIGSIGGALIGANASDKASKEQAQASQNALNTQQQQFGVAETSLSPFINSGANALPTLSALLTPGSSASALAQMPGFQFQSQYGGLSATNALAAQGLGGSSGPLAKAISDYNQGLAGTYYQNTTNALQQLVNSGMGAASSLAGNAVNAGNAEAQTQQAQGNALAAGTLGSANALSGGLTGATGSISNALLLSKLLGGGGSGGIYSSPSAVQGSYGANAAA